MEGEGRSCKSSLAQYQYTPCSKAKRDLAGAEAEDWPCPSDQPWEQACQQLAELMLHSLLACCWAGSDPTACCGPVAA